VAVSRDQHYRWIEEIFSNVEPRQTGSTLRPAATFAYFATRDVAVQPPKALAAGRGTATA
jgi:hypothetical protein